MELSQICDTLAGIIDKLIVGEETCEIGDEYTIDDVIEYLQGFEGELRDLAVRIDQAGKTPDLLKEVFDKYGELWMFQVLYHIESLPTVIGPLLKYAHQSPDAPRP